MRLILLSALAVAALTIGACTPKKAVNAEIQKAIPAANATTFKPGDLGPDYRPVLDLMAQAYANRDTTTLLYVAEHMYDKIPASLAKQYFEVTSQAGVYINGLLGGVRSDPLFVRSINDGQGIIDKLNGLPIDPLEKEFYKAAEIGTLENYAMHLYALTREGVLSEEDKEKFLKQSETYFDLANQLRAKILPGALELEIGRQRTVLPSQKK